MSTYLDSRLLPLDVSGAYLAVHGLFDPSAGEVYRQDTGRAAAFSSHLDDDRKTDLLSAMTTPRPPSKREAKDARKTAKLQLELADSGDGGPTQSRYMRECAERGEFSARIAETEQLWLPTRIAASLNGTAVCSITTRGKGMFGVADAVVMRRFDCRTGELSLDKQVRDTKGNMPGFAQHSYGQFLAIDASATVMLIGSVDSKSAKRNIPKMVFEERSLTDGLRTISSSSPMKVARSGLVANGGDFWITCATEFETRGAAFSILESGTGKLLDEFELSRQPVSLALSADGTLLVCGFIGGAVWAIDLETKKTRKFAPHIGAGREDWAMVQLARSADFFLSESSNGYVITSLEDGTSAPISTPQDTTYEKAPFDDLNAGIRIKSIISVLGNRIGELIDGRVREISADTGEYEDKFVSEAGREGARKPVRVSRKAPIDESIDKARLSAHRETLLSLRSPAAVLRSKKLGKRGWSEPGVQHAPELGASRFGGWPDLPDGSDWPMCDGRPMAFLAQVNLAEAHAEQPELRLPNEGLLSFFLGCMDEVYDKDDDPRERYMVDIAQDRPADAEPGWQVIYTPPSVKLARLSYSESPLPELFNPALMLFKRGGKAFPDEQSAAGNALAFSPPERADYVEMIEQLQSRNEAHQLLGYPSIIQFTPPEFVCEAGGFSFPAEGTYELADFERRAAEWTLLLQLFSDDKVDYLWGDGGMFYFYVRRDALERLDFSDTRVCMET